MEPNEPSSPGRPGAEGVARTLLAGVAVTVPFIVTVAALWWLGGVIDQAVRAVLPLAPGPPPQAQPHSHVVHHRAT